MAKDITSQPWIFDTVGDTEGSANKAVATTVFPVPVFIHQIKVDTGDGGDVLLLQSSGGKRLLKLDNTPANDTLWVPMGEYFDGIHVTTLPTNASLEIYHGVAFRE